MKQMSTDAALPYRLIQAVRTVSLSPELAGMKCGPIVNSRGLTTGQPLLMLWMNEHGLEVEDL